MIRTGALVLLLGFFVTQSAAQNPEMRVVGSASIETGAVIAKTKTDANGMPVAGIKIISALSGLSFDANNGIVGSIESGPGYYILFLSTTERKISIYSPSHKPLDIILSTAGIRLKAQQMWRLEVTGDRKLEVIPVNFLVKPDERGLEIYIDGQLQTSPKNIPVATGKHSLRLVKNGYSTLEKEINVSTETSLFEFELKQVDLQTVTLRSEPKGATVYIDGVAHSKTTDTQVFKYPGTYTAKWTLQDYVDIEQQIVVKEGAPNAFTVKLIKNTGFINWSIIPSDAIVKLNNQPVTGTSVERTPGTYTLTVEKSGYLPFSETLNLERADILKRTITLEKSTATLVWDVMPVTAKLLINREEYTGRRVAELAPGKYLVEISAEGWDEFSESIELRRNETQRKVWALTMQTGGLQITVEPIDAKVTLTRNGADFQTWTGAKILKSIQVGSYALKMEMTGYQTLTKPLLIAKGRTEILDFVLKSALNSTQKPSPAQTGRVVGGAGGGFTNSIGMEMMFIPSGTFKMGSNESDDEKPIHEVTITRPFYLGKYEVTQKQWQGVMGTNPSNFKGDNRPVENVSWNDVQEFIKKLNQKEGGNKYRLPTEAEWEYAARAGSTTKWSFGDSEIRLVEYAWYDTNSGGETHPVGQKKPNAWGLYDVHGNVWEWCNDWYNSSYYQNSPRNDPSGPGSGSNRVFRGGSWDYVAPNTRAADRYYADPSRRYGGVGFRLLRLQ